MTTETDQAKEWKVSVPDPIVPGVEYIDSREAIQRLIYLSRLEGELDADGDPLLDEYELDELALLRELDEDGWATWSDWDDGVLLVRESAWEDFARGEAVDLGLIESDTNWPCDWIDREGAATELKQDYTSIKFGDEDYWGRA